MVIGLIGENLLNRSVISSSSSSSLEEEVEEVESLYLVERLGEGVRSTERYRNGTGHFPLPVTIAVRTRSITTSMFCPSLSRFAFRLETNQKLD